jgi:hypothetical protein
MPPAMTAILQQVREDRGNNGPAVPTPVRSLIDAVRSNGRSAENRPPSMTAILQRVREVCGTEGSASRPSPSTTAAASNSAPATAGAGATAAKKLSTAEILAAARQNAKPSIAATPKPVATSVTKGGSTADILAAARRQGAVKGESTVRKSGEAKPHPVQAPSRPPQPSASVAPPEAPPAGSDGRPRPPAMTDLLASVRSSTLEHQAGIEYPPLAEMVSELRRLDRRAFGHATNPASADGFIARIKRWLSGSRDTYQGASI